MSMPCNYAGNTTLPTGTQLSLHINTPGGLKNRDSMNKIESSLLRFLEVWYVKSSVPYRDRVASMFVIYLVVTRLAQLPSNWLRRRSSWVRFLPIYRWSFHWAFVRMKFMFIRWHRGGHRFLLILCMYVSVPKLYGYKTQRNEKEQ